MQSLPHVRHLTQCHETASIQLCPPTSNTSSWLRWVKGNQTQKGTCPRQLQETTTVQLRFTPKHRPVAHLFKELLC